MITPETDLEKQLLRDAELTTGLNWGKPRKGHPEGSVEQHVVDVLANIDKEEPYDYRTSLRLIAIIHDSFKYKVDRSQPRIGNNHHAVIARQFAEKYITDKNILNIIELHDEAYNAWQVGSRKNNWEKAEYRALRLIERLGDSLELFCSFYKCDNATGTKRGDDYEWFIKIKNRTNAKN